MRAHFVGRPLAPSGFRCQSVVEQGQIGVSRFGHFVYSSARRAIDKKDKWVFNRNISRVAPLQEHWGCNPRDPASLFCKEEFSMTVDFHGN
jgi:hypothetical protein